MELINSLEIIKKLKEELIKKLEDKDTNQNDKFNLLKNIKELDNMMNEYYMLLEKGKIFY